MQKIRAIVNYQFEHDVGRILFPDGVELTYSRRTGRIRHVYYEGKMLATLRPRDGLFSLTIYGAEQLRALLEPLRYRVIVEPGIEAFIRKGRSVFARHVVGVDEEIRPGNEVLVTSGEDTLLAVGKAVLSGREMLAFKRGVAVKVRRGIGGEED